MPVVKCDVKKVPTVMVPTNAFAFILYLHYSVCQTAHAFKCSWIRVCLAISAAHLIQVCRNDHRTHAHCCAANQLTLMIRMGTQPRNITRV